ncbi:MAG: tRNA (guanosine(37)-N1)-methyltransferase TrmD, partial [Eggerthellaceae bacterium]|nr:tRNA (guanosine(37)-N1)-methyltransferase TrmD [Eggerthellaceae bacterium]
CGHYEGIDERAYSLADYVISLGDYVLTSGELASMVVIDAVVRKLPGVLGAEDGPVDESFTSGLLEYPQYTRPANFRGMEVPAMLLSGNHAAIARWRREQSLERTSRLRPDMLEDFDLTPADIKYLNSLSK